MVIVVIITACKTPYTPAPTTAVTNYLVVEGLINISDSTYINLSRTVNVSAATTVKPELKAIVTIESNTGNSYALKELGNGVYAAPSYNLNAANQYRLRIKTANNNTYTSDFAPTMVSPPIDSISWVPTGTALNIYANTHDPKNSTHYYRWDFTEEWEFHSNYNSSLITDGLKISARPASQQIWDCFAGDASSSIALGTSIQLSSDVINGALINTIAADAEKIGIKYIIQVKQYALTKDAYSYWTLLKKNTEQLGSIFDSQPSASIGNLHNVNLPSEPVIGYISAGTVSIQRIFIKKSQLPNWRTTPAYSIEFCLADSLNCCPPPGAVMPYLFPTTDQYVNYKSSTFQGYRYIQTPIDSIYHGKAVGVLAAPPVCVDCTLRGKNTPPAYWK